MPENAETREGPWFCIYGHEHDEHRAVEACNSWWDYSWKGAFCGLHDAGLPLNCTCLPT